MATVQPIVERFTLVFDATCLDELLAVQRLGNFLVRTGVSVTGIKLTNCCHRFIKPLFPVIALGHVEAIGALGAVNTCVVLFSQLPVDAFYNRLIRDSTVVTIVKNHDHTVQENTITVNAGHIRYSSDDTHVNMIFDSPVELITEAKTANYFGIVLDNQTPRDNDLLDVLITQVRKRTNYTVAVVDLTTDNSCVGLVANGDCRRVRPENYSELVSELCRCSHVYLPSTVDNFAAIQMISTNLNCTVLTPATLNAIRVASISKQVQLLDNVNALTDSNICRAVSKQIINNLGTPPKGYLTSRASAFRQLFESYWLQFIRGKQKL